MYVRKKNMIKLLSFPYPLCIIIYCNRQMTRTEADPVYRANDYFFNQDCFCSLVHFFCTFYHHWSNFEHLRLRYFHRLEDWAQISLLLIETVHFECFQIWWTGTYQLIKYSTDQQHLKLQCFWKIRLSSVQVSAIFCLCTVLWLAFVLFRVNFIY